MSILRIILSFKYAQFGGAYARTLHKRYALMIVNKRVERNGEKPYNMHACKCFFEFYLLIVYFDSKHS